MATHWPTHAIPRNDRGNLPPVRCRRCDDVLTWATVDSVCSGRRLLPVVDVVPARTCRCCGLGLSWARAGEWLCPGCAAPPASLWQRLRTVWNVYRKAWGTK